MPKRHPTSRRRRVLTHGASAITGSIAEAVVIKDGPVFFLCERDGRVPMGGGHGFGLYYHDCRFLNGYTMTLGGRPPNALVATASRGYMASVELCNPDLHLEGGVTPKETIGVRWERVIDADQLALRDRITVTNHGLDPVSVPLTLAFQSAFEDIFVVRGMPAKRRGTLHAPESRDGVLCLLYRGDDALFRGTTIRCTPPPRASDGTTLHFALALEPRKPYELCVDVRIGQSTEREGALRMADHLPDPAATERALEQQSEEWVHRHAAVHSPSRPMMRLIGRSLRDLRMLRMQMHGQEFFAAGVPWFVTLFGRDTLITSIETLAFDVEIAASTLRLLASLQGERTDSWTQEEPGKIPHELRVGELARSGAVPYTPYYGTVDATPLFLVLLGRHAAWTGDLALFTELRQNAERALEWIDHYGDHDGDGYVEYENSSNEGLANQGWKDSGDAIMNADGSLARPPIALVEVQGYVYLAKREMAELFRRAGDAERAKRLDAEAAALQQQFERDFWLEDLGCYALALQGDKSPCAVVASNAGQALWSGIAAVEHAHRTAERLMRDDMFSGWGVRTLATGEVRYNPIGYHLGTVWPHDNAIIAAGLRRYGCVKEAGRICTGIAEAALEFRHDRLPELFGGFPRSEFGVPVPYPVADHPQAWAAGSLPSLTITMLGLEPRGFDRLLRVVDPSLPEFVQSLELRRLRVGQAHVDLAFHRAGEEVMVEVLGVDGELEVKTGAAERTRDTQEEAP